MLCRIVQYRTVPVRHSYFVCYQSVLCNSSGLFSLALSRVRGRCCCCCCCGGGFFFTVFGYDNYFCLYVKGAERALPVLLFLKLGLELVVGLRCWYCYDTVALLSLDGWNGMDCSCDAHYGTAGKVLLGLVGDVAIVLVFHQRTVGSVLS